MNGQIDRRYCSAPACPCHALGELTETCKACGCRFVPPRSVPQWVGTVTFRNARYPGAPIPVRIETVSATIAIAKAVRAAKAKLRPGTHINQVCINLTRVKENGS
jgi:hypothetical protein